VETGAIIPRSIALAAENFMPAKKAARSTKPAKKAAPRKAPAPRKAAKPAARKVKSTAVRAKPAKPSKQKPRAPVAPPRPAARTARSGGNHAPPARDAAVQKPKPPVPPAQVAEARTTFTGLQPRGARRLGPVDDDDDATGHNLLLGPRNVRPYRERKGELYMGRD
jgi:hypothetical protein